MKYRVFDTSINKLFGVYDSEEEAMALVRTLVGSNEDNIANDLAVSCEHDDGSFTEPLSGAALVARAERVGDRTGRVVATATNADKIQATRAVQGSVTNARERLGRLRKMPD